MKSQVFKQCRFSLFEVLHLVRNYSTKVRIVAELPSALHNDVDTQVIKPRHHPGIVKTPIRTLPLEIDKAILQVIGDTPIKQLLKDSKNFNSYLSMRHVPLEENDIKEKRLSILREVEDKMNFKKDNASEEELKHYNQVVNSKVTNILKQRIYNWKSIEYSQYMSLVYLVSRGLPEYSVLMRIFSELKQNTPDFQPKNLFDFGSGIGTAIWAAETTWRKSFEEYYCVDTSSHMIDISSRIIEKSGYNILDKVYHRQFLPATYDRKYDIVISAYSLMELPNTSARLQTLHNLWQKTQKYLILVERGSNASFKIINEARDFILMNSKSEEDPNIHYAHIVAPCAHEFACPRYETDKTPCNFYVQYADKYKKGQNNDEIFTYVVFAKGRRKKTDGQWPRIVRPVLLRSRHVVCKLCTSSGRLEQITFSSTKPNRPTYRCAKASKWGDLLPVDIKYVTKTELSSSSSDEEDNDIAISEDKTPLPVKS